MTPTGELILTLDIGTSSVRAALFDGLKALLGRELLLQNVGRVLDLAAAGAGEIAAEQRLEHQHQGIALSPAQMLAKNIAADCYGLAKRYSHDNPNGSRAPGPDELARKPELDLLFFAR